MYLMYVDESGDPGKSVKYNSDHYILSGLIIHVNDWQECLDKLKKLREYLRAEFDLSLKTEIHASELIRIKNINEYRKIRKSSRIKILKLYSMSIPNIFQKSKVINICLNKEDFINKDVQLIAWKRLFQRYDNYMKFGTKERGLVISDTTDETTLRNLLRKMRVYNPITTFTGYDNVEITNIIEDVFFRDSKHSYFIQTVDVISHLLYRKEFPKGSLRKFGIENYFKNIEAILLKEATKYDDLGIVRK